MWNVLMCVIVVLFVWCFWVVVCGGGKKMCWLIVY